MARSLSSQKALRRGRRRAERNKARRSQVKTAVRKVKDAVVARDADAAEKAYRDAARVLDRNVDRRTVHPNTAARRKSRLAKQINVVKAAAGK
ncbi:MAG: 30S ribosomal protein S20 [Phycisphaerae bacterium]|nr:30S ribosomal protein S20 [Phycisphaerae bacterium]